MHLLKTIIFIGLGMILIHCGNNESKGAVVKVDRIEDGVAKTEDGRIVLSSQSEGDLVIPEGGDLEGLRIDRALLINAILSEVKSVSEIYDLSIESSITVDDFNFIGRLTGFYDDGGASLYHYIFSENCFRRYLHRD